MKSAISASLLASLALCTMSATSAGASVIITLPTVSTAGSLVFTDDINFTISNAGGAVWLVFDESVTNDGTQNSIPSASITSAFLSYSINAGATSGVPISGIYDNLTNFFGDATPNDGFVYFGAPVSVAVNDVFTVKAGTYTLAAGSASANFNPQANQTFTGNAYLADFYAVRLSANTSVGAVPEPSTALLGSLAGLALLLRRR
jgi:hypothetical protein